jgi:hypothetical protein
MTEQKYRKNIITRPRQKELDEWKEWGNVRKSHIYVDEEIVKGGYYLQGSWLYKASDVPYPDETHSHNFDEYLGFIGTKFEDPFDLGGVVDLWMDGEFYTLTETCIIFIPAGVDHCPVYARRVDSPIWFLATTHQKMYERDLKGKVGDKSNL